MTYLALGDSYTIGEMVPVFENFPYQLVQLLRAGGYPFTAPEIVAKTGWTTDELAEGISRTRLLPSYHLVSLLVGVNNQYRGRSIENYRQEFSGLFHQALVFAGNNPSRLVVLSIPDWGVTPFAEGRERRQITQEIDSFNRINREQALGAGVHYLDITPGTRLAEKDPELLASDGLHPSGKEYARWAKGIMGLYIPGQ